MTKKLFVVMGLVALLMLSGLAQNKVLDFVLHNKTGADIHAIHISPSDTESWEENIIKEVLEDGESIEIKFSPAHSAVKWDLKVGDVEGTGLIWEDLDLSKINELTLKIVNGKPIAEIR